jgi:hypothetical protein
VELYPTTAASENDYWKKGEGVGALFPPLNSLSSRLPWEVNVLATRGDRSCTLLRLATVGAPLHRQERQKDRINHGWKGRNRACFGEQNEESILQARHQAGRPHLGSDEI